MDQEISALTDAIESLTNEIVISREARVGVCLCGGSPDKLATQHNLDELESKLEAYIQKTLLETETRILKAFHSGSLSPAAIEARNNAARIAVRALSLRPLLDEQVAKADVCLGERK